MIVILIYFEGLFSCKQGLKPTSFPGSLSRRVGENPGNEVGLKPGFLPPPSAGVRYMGGGGGRLSDFHKVNWVHAHTKRSMPPNNLFSLMNVPVAFCARFRSGLLHKPKKTRDTYLVITLAKLGFLVAPPKLKPCRAELGTGWTGDPPRISSWKSLLVLSFFLLLVLF